MNTHTKSLSKFQDADYYSLEEAADYLNKKYEKYEFSGYTVLKQLISYKISTHIYGFGLTTFGSEFIFESNLVSRLEQKDISKFPYNNDDMAVELSEFLRAESKNTGLFLELKYRDLVQLGMQKQVITPTFQDVIPFDYISKASNLREVIECLWKEEVSNYTTKVRNILDENKINYTKALFENFVQVENVCSGKELQEYVNNKSYLSIKPKLVEVAKDADELEDLCYFKIDLDDILLIRKNLITLEKYLIGEEIYIDSQKNIKSFNSSKSPLGKSKNKEKAQWAAKTLASHFWKSDIKQEIRIKEMCVIVFGELLQSEHNEQLPDKSPSLKDWIKDVAPSYAREAGRPKEI